MELNIKKLKAGDVLMHKLTEEKIIVITIVEGLVHASKSAETVLALSEAMLIAFRYHSTQAD